MQGEKRANGVIARFKNESAEREAGEAHSIRAELVLRDVNEQELEQGLHAACWLKEHTNNVDFSVGEDHWVLLGAVDPDDKEVWLLPWKEEKKSWEGTYYELQDYRVRGMRSIEIRLLGPSNRWLLYPVVIDIVVNDGVPAVAVRPPRD